MESTSRRLITLLGSRSALSTPVIIGIAITGGVLSFTYSVVVSRAVGLWEASVGLGAFVLGVLLLQAFRLLGRSTRWTTPHAGFVLLAFTLTNLLRSVATSFVVRSHAGGTVSDSNPVVRTFASLIVTVVLGLILSASVQLAHERAEATAQLRAEQQRLLALAENLDAELSRADAELRARAFALLEPTIEEIRTLLAGQVSESDSLQVSERIVEVVNNVVRPASRDLAISPQIELKQFDAEVSKPNHLLSDRMDITQAIKPFWMLLLSWGVLFVGPLLTGAKLPVMVLWFGFSLTIALFLLAMKRFWPPLLREMRVVVGLTVLLVIYMIINIGLQLVLARWGGESARGSAAWTNSHGLAVLVRVAIAMLVSILATLHIHGEQIRAQLVDTNEQLQGLISRIRRETWLVHRSVSLTVHGTVQSALVSTAMRLTTPDRNPETVADARRRLEEALAAISADYNAEARVENALQDLQDLWASIVRITFDVSPDADSLLSSDSGMRQCTVEICREATSNAIRHGHAKEVDIRIGTAGGSLEIRVDDDGQGISPSVMPGLGSSMLNDICLHWSLLPRTEGGSRLLANVV